MSTLAPDHVMQRSPYDRPDAPAQPLAPASESAVTQWVASRFNARTTADDGRLVLWNTLTGAVSVFAPAQAPVVERLLARDGVTAPDRGVVHYLAGRGFIVPKHEDEMRRFRLQMRMRHYRRDMLGLIFLASEDCNFRCVYCYERFKRGTMLPDVREGVKKYLLSRARELRQFNVAWFGGEPLYGWEAVEDLAPFCRQLARDHEIAYYAHMTTNAYLLTPERAAKLLSWDVRDFQITLDGIAEEHDRKRVGRDGSPTFATILANLQALKAMDEPFNIHLRHNYDHANLPRAREYVDLLAATFGGDSRFRLFMHAVGKWGGDNDATLDVYERNDKREQTEVEELAYEKGLSVRGGVSQLSGIGTLACYASKPNSFVIGADGTVMKCTVALDTDRRNIVGRLTPDGTMELDADRLAMWTDPQFEQDEVCANCYLMPSCQGMVCPASRLGKGRSCHPTRYNLRRHLLETLALREKHGREVVVPAMQTGVS